jgi:hypothetical protein
MDWIFPARNMDQCLSLAIKVMNLHVPVNNEEFLGPSASY